MVAHQDAAEAVLDQPGVAIGTLELVAAGVAQGERSVAPPVEKEQGLLAPIERCEDFSREARRDPAAALGRLLAHVERGDIWHRRFGKA